MTEILKSKKMILSLVGLVAVTALVLTNHDMETLKWVGGFITGIVASLNLGQGLADGQIVFGVGRQAATDRDPFLVATEVAPQVDRRVVDGQHRIVDRGDPGPVVAGMRRDRGSEFGIPLVVVGHL